MSVLIKGMEMLKDGVYWCEIGVADGIATITIHGEERKSFPLISVPPHGRLGDMDAIARKIRRFGDYVEFTKDEIAGWFENGDFETIIPAEEGEDG